MNVCPACESDNYVCLEEDDNGPDYDGEKECWDCGEVWL